MNGADHDETVYRVVVNAEEQYSIWPADRTLPVGWSDVGKTGPKAECLAHIKNVWTDMRPLSLRKRMESDGTRVQAPTRSDDLKQAGIGAPRRLDDLVQQLSEGDHPVVADVRPARSAIALKACIDRQFVLLKFTGTKGGTELGVRLDPGEVDASEADFSAATGTVRLSGGLTLNGVPVQCVVRIALDTLEGTGHLEL